MLDTHTPSVQPHHSIADLEIQSTVMMPHHLVIAIEHSQEKNMGGERAKMSCVLFHPHGELFSMVVWIMNQYMIAAWQESVSYWMANLKSLSSYTAWAPSPSSYPTRTSCFQLKSLHYNKEIPQTEPKQKKTLIPMSPITPSHCSHATFLQKGEFRENAKITVKILLVE